MALKQYTESDVRALATDTFMAFLGCKRGDKTHRKIVDTYNTIKPLPRGYKLITSDAWCAATVSAVAQICGLTTWVFPECSCSKMIEKYKAAGRWEENDAYTPIIGDLVMYDWDDGKDYATTDDTGAPEHVGMVVQVGNGEFKVIEGNKGSESVCGLRSMKVNGRYIRGFCKPDYKAAAVSLSASAKTETSQSSSTTPSYCSIQLPILTRGAEGDSVLALRRLLAAARCGSGTITNEFDEKTEIALKEYQRGHKLTVDGSCGPATWASLLGGKTK